MGPPAAGRMITSAKTQLFWVKSHPSRPPWEQGSVGLAVLRGWEVSITQWGQGLEAAFKPTEVKNSPEGWGAPGDEMSPRPQPRWDAFNSGIAFVGPRVPTEWNGRWGICQSGFIPSNPSPDPALRNGP